MAANIEINTILYATDLGDHMRPVFRHAVTMAKLYEAQIIMLHVVEPLSTSAETVLSLYLQQEQLDAIEADGMDEVVTTMKRRLKKYCEDESEICGKSSGVTRIVVESGHANDIIIAQATRHDADLIVMGNCAGKKLAHGLLGSTARRITHEARVPVLLVPNCR